MTEETKKKEPLSMEEILKIFEIYAKAKEKATGIKYQGTLLEADGSETLLRLPDEDEVSIEFEDRSDSEN